MSPINWPMARRARSITRRQRPTRWPTAGMSSSAMPSLSPLDTPFKPVAPPPPPDGLPKRTLLIVDDEEGPRQSLRIVFKDDYNVLLADTGNKALDLVKQQSVDA